MPELHAVVPDSPETIPSLKRQILLFDKFHLAYLTDSVPEDDQAYDAYKVDLEYLRSRGVMLDFDDQTMLEAMFHANEALTHDFAQNWHSVKEDMKDAIIDFVVKSRELRNSSLRDDYMVRHLSTTMSGNPEFDVVPICRNSLPTTLTSPTARSEQVLAVAVEGLPLPDATCSWEEILDFKASLHDKRWGFHRFLRSLATKQLTEAEIRDEIEWMVSEYTKAMELHQIKSSQGFFEAYVIPAIEIIEDLAKFNWSKIAKGTLSVGKRKVELMEAEMKAPGRECAYVFDARRTFGPKA